MPAPKQLDPIECKNIIRNLIGTDNPDLKKKQFDNGSFTCFDRLSFQVQIGERPNPFTVTKLKIVLNGVFTLQLIIYDWISRPKTSSSN